MPKREAANGNPTGTNRGMTRPREVRDASAWLADMARKYADVYYILGNHDVDMPNDHFDRENIYDVDVTPWLKCGPFTARAGTRHGYPAGSVFGASLSPCFDRPELAREWARMTADPDEDQLLWDAMPHADIIVSHCPPSGVLDVAGRLMSLAPDAAITLGDERHIGPPGLRSYLGREKPRLVVCGHVHEAAGSVYSDGTDTLVVNCARTAVVVEMPPTSACAVVWGR